MSYFEEMTQKAREVMANAAGKAREAADSAKISAAIIAEKRELDKHYRVVGQWYASECTGEAPEAIADVIAPGQPRGRRDGGGRRGRRRQGLPCLRQDQRQQVLPPLRRTHGRVTRYIYFFLKERASKRTLARNCVSLMGGHHRALKRNVSFAQIFF